MMTKRSISEETIKACQAKFNLTHQIANAFSCQEQVGFEGKDILEVGGALPKEFVFDYLGVRTWSAVDPSVFENREYAGNCGGNYFCYESDVKDLSAEHHEKYDLIFSNAAFEHIRDLGLSVKKMFQCLKNGGRLFSAFAPIWSSSEGHHLRNVVDFNGNVLDVSDIQIPPWGHLLMDPQELYDYLISVTTHDKAKLIVNEIYFSNDLNRMFTEDYVACIQQSDFVVERLGGTFNIPVDTEIQAALERKHPGKRQFANIGMLIILKKRPTWKIHDTASNENRPRDISDDVRSNPEMLNNLGCRHFLQGREDLAMEHFQDALRLDPGNPAAITNMLYIKINSGSNASFPAVKTPGHFPGEKKATHGSSTDCSDKHSCLFLNTYYEKFVDAFYRKNPFLLSKPYAGQKNCLQNESFGDSDFYSQGMRNAGWNAEDLIINCKTLQKTWAKEVGFEGDLIGIALQQVRSAKPDVVYFQDLSVATKDFLSKICPYTKLIVGQIASPIPEQANLKGFHIIFSSFPHFVARFRKAGITSYYQPLAFDPRVLEKIENSERTYPVTFVGGISSLHGKGKEIIEKLAALIPFDSWGYGVGSLPDHSPIRKRHHGEAWGLDMFSVLRRSKITINRHIDVAENYANNMRLFEATGCGALLITDYKDNLDELFEIGKEVVSYRSAEECAELVKYYLRNPKEAEEIARAGQARTLCDHTYTKRMEQTAEILERHLRYKQERDRYPAPDTSSNNKPLRVGKARSVNNVKNYEALHRTGNLGQRKPNNWKENDLALIQINTFYPAFLNEVYNKIKGLDKRPFEEQISIILDQGFSAIHTFVPYIDSLGYSSKFIIANNPHSQLRWAQEHGIDMQQHRNQFDELLKIQIETIKPDVLLMSDAFAFDSQFLRRLGVKPPLIAGWSGEYVPPQVSWSGYDVILSNFKYVLGQAISKGAATAQSFHPGFLKWLYDEVRDTSPDYDVVFVGQWSDLHHMRNELVAEVAKESLRTGKFSLALYLSGDKNKMPPEVRECYRGECFGLAMHRALRSGRIALNAETTPNLEFVQEAGNMRMFETTGTGVFLLTQYHDNISDYFTPGEEIETFQDKTELIEKIYYYLAHQEKRETIAQRGQERCLREYSMERQLEKLDKIFRTYLSDGEGINGQLSSPNCGCTAVSDGGETRFENEAVHIRAYEENLEVLKDIAEKERPGHWCVDCFGLKIYCHDLLSFYYSAKNIFIRGIYDFETDNLEPVIIDGGGHIGLFALRMKQKFPNSKLIIFEPDKVSLKLLKQNLKVNSLSCDKIVEAGLHRFNGQISFSSDHSDSSSIFTQEVGNSINVVPLSKYIDSEVDFLKLNIEGAELDVITEVAHKLPLIKEVVIEYHGFPETGQNLHKILAILDRAGFRYLIHDFDASEQMVTKPPFRLEEDTRFYLLIYAKRMFQRSASNDPKDKDAVEGSPAVSSIIDVISRDVNDLLGESNETSERRQVNNLSPLAPISPLFGCDRGTPIDRYYIERFIQANKSCITGHVLEIGDDSYTRKYGEGVVQSDVLNYRPSQRTTIVGDLTTGKNIPVAAFDCIIMTQTIQFIYDIRAAIKNAFAALRPGGTVLLTTSGLSQISRYDMERWGDYWRITDKCMKMLLEEVFDAAKVHVQAYGNVAVAKAFLDGLALHEVDPKILGHCDNDYQIVVSAFALK